MVLMVVGRELKKFNEGYQLWETVSEESPITPFFEDIDKLIDYLLKNDDSITRYMTRDNWKEFFENSFGYIDCNTKKFVSK